MQMNKYIKNMKDQVVEELKRLCGKVEWMPGLGHYFLINSTLCVYMFCKGTDSLRFTIPYLAKATENNKSKMMDLVNQTNREVTYHQCAGICIKLHYRENRRIVTFK